MLTAEAKNGNLVAYLREPAFCRASTDTLHPRENAAGVYRELSVNAEFNCDTQTVAGRPCLSRRGTCQDTASSSRRGKRFRYSCRSTADRALNLCRSDNACLPNPKLFSR